MTRAFQSGSTREFRLADHARGGTHLAAVPVRAAHAHGLDVERVHPPGPLPEPPPEPAGGHPRRRARGDARQRVLARRLLVLERPPRGFGRVDLAAVHPARAPRARLRQQPRRRLLLLDPAVVHRAARRRRHGLAVFGGSDNEEAARGWSGAAGEARALVIGEFGAWFTPAPRQ